MRQLDDGIVDTLVLALKVPGDGRSPIPLNVDSTSAPPMLPSSQTGTVPKIDVLSRYGNRLGRTSFHEAQYKGVADTIVQLIRRRTSGVIA